MGEDDTVIVVRFFRLRSGGEPVRDWLLGLPEEDRKAIGVDIKTVEFGWPLGMPLGQGLWEVRSPLPSGRIARVLFVIRNQRMILLHGFIKKTRQTPHADLELARIRQREVGL